MSIVSHLVVIHLKHITILLADQQRILSNFFLNIGK